MPAHRTDGPTLSIPPGRATYGRSVGEALAAKGVETGKPKARANRGEAKEPKRRRGVMNGTEKEWAGFLDLRKAAGEVLWWRFEAMSLTLTDGFDSSHKRVVYTGDFLVLTADGEIQVHETKGGLARKADILRLKVAADAYRELFAFVLAQKLPKKRGGGWKVERL